MPVQLRLGFASHAQPFRIHLTLLGLMIAVTIDGVSEDIAFTSLSTSGVPVARRPDGLAFPVAGLPTLVTLDEDITVIVEPKLEALWELVSYPSSDGTPVEVLLDGATELVVRWHDGNAAHSVSLHPDAAAALLSLDIPFVAASEAFEYLRKTCSLPMLLGRARVTLDGYIQITTSKPQLAETADIPALFRIDSTTLGVPLSYAYAVSAAPGFVWDTQPGQPQPPSIDDLGVRLNPDTRSELYDFTAELAATRARVVAWSPGLGRRFFALASAISLQALPILVVCPPSSIWAWQRHAQLLGHTSGSSAGVDVTVVTYGLLASGYDQAVGTVIFDSLLDALETPGMASQARRLVATSDAVRIGVEDRWDCPLDKALEIMSVLRPAEFDTDYPVPARYPVDPYKRFEQHVACYLSVRENQQTSLEGFKTSSVLALDIPSELLEAADRVKAGSSAPQVKLTKLLEMASFGTSHILGPKVSTAVRLANDAIQEGGRVALVSSQARTCELLAALLRGSEVVDSRWSKTPVRANGQASIVLYERDIPPLSDFTHAVIVDYPWSTAVIDDAVGSAAMSGGVSNVTVLHLKASLDDRLAVLAAFRRDGRGVAGHSRPPTDAEMSWLLS